MSTEAPAPAAPPEEPKVTSDNNPYSFDSIVGVPAKAARQIRQKATRFQEHPSEFKEYALRAALIHALVMDWHARNSQEQDKAKVAAESFLKIAGQLTAPTKGKK